MPVTVYRRDLMKLAKISAAGTYYKCIRDLFQYPNIFFNIPVSHAFLESGTGKSDYILKQSVWRIVFFSNIKCQAIVWTELILDYFKSFFWFICQVRRFAIKYNPFFLPHRWIKGEGWWSGALSKSKLHICLWMVMKTAYKCMLDVQQCYCKSAPDYL